MGTRVSSLVALNGNHFTFNGFGQEFEGLVTGWQGGSLESDHVLRDEITVTLAARRPYASADLEQLYAEEEFNSDHPAVARVNLRVSSMTVQINPPLNL